MRTPCTITVRFTCRAAVRSGKALRIPMFRAGTAAAYSSPQPQGEVSWIRKMRKPASRGR
ncbi:hypothetical protein HY624_04340 [Candidatus Uhrbacteria bacterium]|nr:hypothetical protein [Candidatus Uhrbacteria bacterium]